MKINTKHGKCNIVVEYDKGVTNRQEHYANHWDRDNSIHGWYIKPSFTVIFKSDVDVEICVAVKDQFRDLMLSEEYFKSCLCGDYTYHPEWKETTDTWYLDDNTKEDKDGFKDSVKNVIEMMRVKK